MMFSITATLFTMSMTIQSVVGQDPASGWMAYAVGKIPDGVNRITRLEMTWQIGAMPVKSRAFFSPWFGMDPDDNLNLIQPVNPWSGKTEQWSMYTEYYQWSPTRNSNSKTYNANSGQTLHGSLIYNGTDDSYLLSQTILETNETSSQVVPCQSGKLYTIPYIVYEKTFPCQDYPPDEEVVFYDIIAECDEVDCKDDIIWSSEVKDENCDMKANILSSSSISISWNNSASSKYDQYTDAELYDLNMHGKWANALNLERPRD